MIFRGGLAAALVALGLVLFAASVAKAKTRVSAEHDSSPHDYTNHAVAFERDSLGFEKLEEYLQDETSDETDLGVNMRAARRLLERELGKPSEIQDTELLRALKQFLTLGNMNQCNRESYATLTSLKAAARYPIDRLAANRKRGPLRRIEFIMAECALSHALKCKSVYPIVFSSAYARLMRDPLDQIDALMEVVIDSRLRASGASRAKPGSVLRRLYSNFMDKNDSFKSLQDARLIFDHLRSKMAASSSSSQRNRTGTELGEASHNVREMVLERVIAPCHYYTQHMGSDIFIPAQLDSGILDRSNRYKPGVGERRDGFIYGWARFGFCAMLQRDQNHLIKKMISLMPPN